MAGVDKEVAGVDKKVAGVDKKVAGVDKKVAVWILSEQLCPSSSRQSCRHTKSLSQG